jgi:hypothetical protein
MKARVIIITLIFSLLISLGLSAQVQQNSFINLPDSPIQVFAEVETGFVKVLSHTFQSGDTGTNFNFVTQGGQEILFPFQRVTLGANLGDRHLISALYQPLTIETEVTFRDDVTIDGVPFDADSPMRLKYGFPFWRFTYGYDFVADENLDVYGGLALQLRNASIVFQEIGGAEADNQPESGTGAGPVHRSGLHPSLGYRAEFRSHRAVCIQRIDKRCQLRIRRKHPRYIPALERTPAAGRIDLPQRPLPGRNCRGGQRVPRPFLDPGPGRLHLKQTGDPEPDSGGLHPLNCSHEGTHSPLAGADKRNPGCPP